MSVSIHPVSFGHEAIRRRSPRLLAVVVALATMVLSVLPAGAALDDHKDQAAAGAAWLDAQVDLNVPLQLFGSADWGVTIDAATALAAVNAADPRIDTVWNAIVAQREEVVAKAGADVPGALAKVILLAHALGKDPRAVGTGAGADLVARLAATRQDNGLFGTQFPNYDGVYRQGMAIVALAAAGATVDPSAIEWLLDQQCSNGTFAGGFMSYRADTTADCFDDPDNWQGADTNATALAVSAIVAAGRSHSGADAALSGALDWLASRQSGNGGWASNSWGPVDPNSTAVIVQALIAAGELDAARFNTGELSPLAALADFQIRNSEDQGEVGAFRFPGVGDGPNLLATVQAVPALAGRPLAFVAAAPTTPQEPTTTTTTSTVATTAPAAPTTTAAAVLAGGESRSPAAAGERRLSFTG